MENVCLRPDVIIKVVYEDNTHFGSPMGDRPEQIVRELFRPVMEHVEQQGYQSLIEAPALLRSVVDGELFTHFGTLTSDGWQLHDAVLYPDPADALPSGLLMAREAINQKIEVTLPVSYWPLVHQLIADLEADGVNPDDPNLDNDMRNFLAGLIQGDFVVPQSSLPPVDGALHKQHLTFLGHNTVLVRSEKATLLIDPLMFPVSADNPDDYQPLQLREIGPIDAILITHSHPDHFDPASLLRFPVDVPIIIPRCDRETILCAAMEHRLNELGFTNIRVMDWNETSEVSDVLVHALPFYGEQPTDGQMLSDTVRNVGNTYLLKTPIFSALFLADSGYDDRGNVKDLASQIRETYGTVDVVFSGYRGWLLYPVQFLFSSVARYLLFVPPRQWSIRQQIMSTADQAIDVAERVGARYLIPYADGGAPWHWRIELGPRMDGEGTEIAGFDYFPEHVSRIAQQRSELLDGSMLRSAVETIILRPNQSVRVDGQGIQHHTLSGNAWPFSE